MNLEHQGLIQVKGAVEAVGFQHVTDAAVETFRCPLMVCKQTMRGDHAVGLRGFRRGQAVLDAQFGAEQVEFVGAGGCPRPVCQFLPMRRRR